MRCITAGMVAAAIVAGGVAGQEAVLQNGQQGAILALAFAPGERLLATAGSDQTVQVRDLVAGTVLFSRSLDGEPSALAFSPDASVLAACGHTGEGHGFLQAWNVRTGATGVMLSFEGHRGLPCALAWSAGDGPLAVAGFHGAVMILDPVTFETRTVLRGNEMSSDLRLAISTDGTQVAVGARNGTLRLWNPGSGAMLHDLQLPAWLSAVSFRTDGSLLAGLTPHQKDPEVLVVRKGETVERRTLPHPGGAHALAFSGDGASVMTVGREVRRWELAGGRLLWTAPRAGEWSLGLSFSPGGTFVGSAGGVHDQNHGFRGAVMDTRAGIEIWDGTTGAVRHPGPKGLPAVLALAFSPDGRTLACGTDGPDPMIVFWDLDRARPALRLTGPGPVRRIAFHPEGRKLITSGWRDGLHTFNLGDDVSAGKDLGPGHGGIHFDLSSGGRLLAVTHDIPTDPDPGTLEIRDLDTGERRHTLVRNDRVAGTVFLPDGSSLAAAVEGYRDGQDTAEIRIFDAVSGRPLRTLAVPPRPGPVRRRGISDLSVSPDGRFLAAGRFHDRLTRAQVPGGTALWELASGELKWSSRAEPPYAWLDGGRTLVTGGMMAINAATGAAREAFVSSDASRAFSDLVVSLDGSVVAGVQPGFRSGPAAWSVLHLAGMRPPSAPAITRRIPAPTHAAACDPRGGMFATAGGDGLIRIWNPKNGALRASLAVFPTDSAPDPGYEWAALLPSGIHSASPGLGSRILWRSGDRMLNAAEAGRDLHRPELVVRALAGP